MAEEPTSVEEPTVAEPTPTDAPADDFDSQVLAKVRDLGVENVQQLDGMATASAQSGNLARLLGEVKSENAELKQMIQQGQRAVDDGYDTSGGETVDLGALIDKRLATGLETFWENKSQKQVQANQKYSKDVATIQNDPDFPAIQGIWNQYYSQPDTQQRIISGQTTMLGEYDKLARTFLRESLKRTSGQTQQLADAQTVTPPHMESGDTRSIPLPTSTEEQATRLANLTKPENWTGSNDNIESLVKTIFPDDDPFFAK